MHDLVNDSNRDEQVAPDHEEGAAPVSKKLQRRLLKVEHRAQQKAARAQAAADGADTSAFRQRKRRSQRDCNREGALKRRASSTTASAVAKPSATYTKCTSASCGDGDGCRLRRIAPYVHRYETFVKARWCGRTLADVFANEFAGLPPAYCEAAIASGLIRINGERKAREYVVRDGDFLAHVVHRHEPPDGTIVVFDGEEVVVVNKPSSVPVHPSGAYFHNSMTMLLQSEYELPELFPVHRLDRLTSGLLLLAKSTEKARVLCEDIASGAVQKHYVAREEAIALAQVSRKELAGGAYWSLSAPIGCVSSADHLQGVQRDGKAAETLVRALSFDGTHSVVECLPVTGRTHQIRVHLKFLGFPIVNDPQYGPESDSVSMDQDELDKTGAVEPVRSGSEGSFASDRVAISDDAARCAAICCACRDGDQAVLSLVQRECFAMWLHSFKYTSGKWAFEVPLPRWARAQAT
ncbi:hypothetical protein PybrP1_001431 [[Pythium] brassicae (nom. inval.)]|nr:hypothetical protein PybrP1_001431 [[Pythium] brassicae (nom. inval.)]